MDRHYFAITDNVVIYLALGSLTFSLLIVFFLLYREWRIRKGFEAKFRAMEVLFKNTRQQNESLTKQLNELRAGAMGMSQKLAELSTRFTVLIDKHDQLEMNDVEGRLYTRASKMVDLGAGLHELMEECELPKAEAELLLNIKKHRMMR